MGASYQPPCNLPFSSCWARWLHSRLLDGVCLPAPGASCFAGPAPGSPLLKPEAQAHLHASLALDMALPGQAPFAAVVEAKKEEAAAAGASHTASGGAATGRTMEAPGAGASGAAQDAAAAVTAAGPRFTASGSKVPKWLKLG